MQKLELSIVIPFYNERKNITPLIQTYAKIRQYKFELLCVNNGSNDRSETVFTAVKKKYDFIKIINVKQNKGYGHGIMQGVKAARGDIIAWTHADMQTRPEDVFRAYEMYKKYNDPHRIIKGRRVHRPLGPYLFSLGMAVLSSIMLRCILYEINAQPKLFHRSFLPYLKHAPDDFSLDLFLLYQAKRNNYTITSFNVHFHNRLHGTSKWAYSFRSRWKTIRRYLVSLWTLATTIN